MSTKPTKLSYFELLDQFWRLDAERSFTANETRLYFYLLNQFNSARWGAKICRRTNQVAADLNADHKTINTARLILETRGLVSYEAGNKVIAATWRLAYGAAGDGPEMDGNNSRQSESDCSQIDGKNYRSSGSNTADSSGMDGKNSRLYKEKNKTSSVVEEKEEEDPTPAAHAAAVGAEKKIENDLASLPAQPTAPTIAPPDAVASPKPAKPRASGSEPEHFPAFWQAWPKKEGRLDAARAFAKLSADDQAAAASRADTWLTSRPDLLDPARYRFIPHASTWLNQQRWTDEAPITSTAFPASNHGYANTYPTQRSANGAKPTANAGQMARALSQLARQSG